MTVARVTLIRVHFDTHFCGHLKRSPDSGQKADRRTQPANSLQFINVYDLSGLILFNQCEVIKKLIDNMVACDQLTMFVYVHWYAIGYGVAQYG